MSLIIVLMSDDTPSEKQTQFGPSGICNAVLDGLPASFSLPEAKQFRKSKLGSRAMRLHLSQRVPARKRKEEDCAKSARCLNNPRALRTDGRFIMTALRRLKTGFYQLLISLVSRIQQMLVQHWWSLGLFSTVSFWSCRFFILCLNIFIHVMCAKG